MGNSNRHALPVSLVIAGSVTWISLTGCGANKSANGEQQGQQTTTEQFKAAAQATRTISDGNSTRTESAYKPCFPTRKALEKWLTFSIDAEYQAKYDYISHNDPYTLSPGDKVRVVQRDDEPFQDGQTIIRLYIVPDKKMPFPGDGQTCFASDDGALLSDE